jgi:glycosyltransferase involved in cell wall biosynthesis
MTGTDLYRDLPAGNSKALASLEMADHVVLLQPEAIACIPQHIRKRCRVIYQSVSSGQALPKPTHCFMVTVIGHLRDEKDPMRTAIALQHIPKTIPIKVIHLGMVMQENFEAEVKRLSAQDIRYKWIGQRSHPNTLRWLASSHLMVISSIMEGGAHVVSEAIALGIPVLASDIAGNRGLLGDDYPGFFPVRDERALANLLMRAESDPAYMRTLTEAIDKRHALIKPTREFNDLKSLIDVSGS